MKGKDVLDALRKKLGVTTDQELASHLGVSTKAIRNWKNRPTVTARQLAGLVHSKGRASTASAHDTAIRPIVEFFKIDSCESANGSKRELFDVSSHPYREGLKGELETLHGVYVFFDSRGQAIYAGKAKRQSLWAEMKSAFNRSRKSVQKIRRVRHPEIRVEYKTSEEKARQIVEYAVPLHEMATYFSAYKVVDELIDELESLLVRSFANDLLNIKMERFGKHRKAPV